MSLAIIFGASPSHANSVAKSYFFATQEACSASSVFNWRECANAFRNAETELDENAPKFQTRSECVLRFMQCESDDAHLSTEPERQDGDAFRPMMLGVEISYDGNRGVVTPVLAAVHPAGMFKARPISRLDVVLPALANKQSPQILRGDRFEPFRFQAAVGVPSPSAASRAKSDPPIQAEPENSRDRAARRERLNAAPFIE